MNEQINKSLQINIVKNVRDLLEIQGECSTTELYRLLREYRNQIHPDRYSEESSKKIAEVKFKQANQLLQELFLYIQNESLNRTPTELVLYKPIYDHVLTQAALDRSQEEINDLKQRLDLRDWEIDRLKKQLDDKEKQEFEDERKKVESLYTMSRRGWASMGIALILSGLLTIMTKIEDVSAKLKKYSPIDEKYLNLFLFIVFITVLMLTLKKYVENKIMKRRLDQVCSAIVSNGFIAYLEQKSRGKEVKDFNEYEVFEYLYGPKHWWKKILSACGFVHFQINKIEQLKDFFISNLLRKRLVSISYANKLDRSFTIKFKGKHWDL